MLMGHGVSVTLVDIKPAQIELSGTYGAKVWYGDGRRIDLLRKAGADDAELILFCLDDRNLSMKELEPILHSFPQASVFVRAFDRRQLIEFRAIGENAAVRELYESAIRMGIEALGAIGATEEEIGGVEADYRDRDSRRLAAQIDSGNLHALKEIFYRPEGKL
jgi:glutathione-regulated potassium-efflux system protein KefB